MGWRSLRCLVMPYAPPRMTLPENQLHLPDTLYASQRTCQDGARDEKTAA